MYMQIYVCVYNAGGRVTATVRAAITPPVYDRVTPRPCDMPVRKAPCDGRRGAKARHASPSATRIESIQQGGDSNHATNILPETGCNMQGKDATFNERTQHARKGCNMQDKEATCSMHPGGCRGGVPRGVARALTVTLRKR